MTDKFQRQQLFDSILREYSSLVARICYMYGADEEQRKDLYQECMLNVWQGLKNYRGDSRLSTWLYRACINTCITSYRRNRRHSNTVSLDEVLTPVVSDDTSRTAELTELYRLISFLSAVDKAIIMMWLDEKSYDEISEITGMPRNTVASRIHRIKEQLVKLSNS